MGANCFNRHTSFAPYCDGLRSARFCKQLRQNGLVWDPCCSEFADGMAQPSCGSICILSERCRPRLGFERYLSRYDAIHGHPIDWANSLVQLPTISTVASKHYGRVVTKRGGPMRPPFSLQLCWANRNSDHQKIFFTKPNLKLPCELYKHAGPQS